MADTEDQEFEQAFEGFGDDPAPVTPPSDDPKEPPVTPPAAVEPPKEESKPTDDSKKKEDPSKEAPAGQPPATDDKKEEEVAKTPEAPETPPAGDSKETEAPATPQPLTKDDVKSVVSDLLNTERTSSKELEITTEEVLEKYYPEGLSNVLTDEASGKELRAPQDVVDASGGTMTLEQAAQWLLNEQYKLDNQVAKIKSDARAIAETTINFKRDAMTALEKYQPLFKAYPQLQQKVYDKLMKQVKVDKDHGVILSAPDVLEHYDDYLEPYRMAFEYSTNNPATDPVKPPEPPKPTAEDRMDEGGDGGQSPVDDPNDFAQQVSKELERGI